MRDVFGSSSRLYDVWGVLVVVGTLTWIVFGLWSSGLESEELPTCDDVWKAGNELADDYAGCQYASGVVDSGLICADGTVLFDYEHRLYAPAGGTITTGYEAAYLRCLGS